MTTDVVSRCVVVVGQWTERLDYHGASSLLYYSLFNIALFCVRVNGDRLYYSPTSAAAVGAALAALFVAHVAYLNVIDFDYGTSDTLGRITA